LITIVALIGIFSGSLVFTVAEKRNSFYDNVAEIYYRVVARDLAVRFEVTANGLPFKDALININGSNYLTDGLGNATVSLLAAASYNYTVGQAYNYTDYQRVNGTVTITNTGITVKIQLVPAQMD
jgi:hypothetical protein